MDTITQNPKITIIKNIYLYLVSFVALMMIVFSVSSLINVVLKTYVFKQADNFGYYPTKSACLNTPTIAGQPQMTPDQCAEQERDMAKQQEQNTRASRQNTIVQDISLIVVAVPLFAYHWRIIRKKEIN